VLDDARPTERPLQYGVGIPTLCRGGHRGGLIFRTHRMLLRPPLARRPLERPAHPGM